MTTWTGLSAFPSTNVFSAPLARTAAAHAINNALVIGSDPDRLLEQIMWLPVLSKGAVQGIDKPNHRILVRNNLVVPP